MIPERGREMLSLCRTTSQQHAGALLSLTDHRSKLISEPVDQVSQARGEALGEHTCIVEGCLFSTDPEKQDNDETNKALENKRATIECFFGTWDT